MAPRLKQLTVPEMRAKAVLRAVEKLLEQGAASEAQLWSVARVMSALEFDQATEERSLYGVCGNPLCNHRLDEPQLKGRYSIDTATQQVFEIGEGPRFCGGECGAAAESFMLRLGSDVQALRRFERLWEEVQQRRAAVTQQDQPLSSAANGSSGAEAPAAPSGSEGVAEVAEPSRPKGVLKKNTEFAAGSSKAPIMLSEVQERTPDSSSTAAAEAGKPGAASSARRAHTVEGYVPRARSNFKLAASASAEGGRGRGGRRVRFSDDGGALAGDAATADAGAAAAHAPQLERAAAALPASAPAPAAATGSAGAPAHPVLVFDVEDAEGPLEGGQLGLGTRFGRLRVADAAELGVPPSPGARAAAPAASAGPGDVGGNAALSSGAGTESCAAEADVRGGSSSAGSPAGPAANGHGDEEVEASAALSVDEVLLQRLRQGVQRHFPALAATLPPELAAQLDAEDSASEAASTDTEAERWESLDTTDEEDEEGGRGGRSSFRSHLTFFGELFTHLEAWVTGDTLRLLGAGPEAPPPPHISAAVPEIYTALSKLLGAAVPLVLARLEAAGARARAERGLDELLRTLRLASALPAFRAGQWQVVALVLLKALSLERVPALRAAFESREGSQRVGQALGAGAFTIEEFYAVLELVVPVGEG